MKSSWQLVIDCNDPRVMVEFWSQAMHYIPEPPPSPHTTWRSYWQAMGVPAEELPPGAGDIPESLIDPQGHGPRWWFQQVPESKSIKNRLHVDLLVGGGRSVPFEERKTQVNKEAERLVALGASIRSVMDLPEMDHFAACMADPEGNEFDVV
ncbi:VOC family protein [Arthrobacter sp. S41]|uniref:VOC family protein n=1 Tax=Micrococcaceae TaxID=1268 RepID=UPI001036E257|nr:VOC family protein [Arthrobacter sp. S41]TAP28345.1 VOC family protein [Arthrobacter sp. S41]